MKMFFLMRHGKSDWSDPALADFERPLTDRGRKDARRIGEFLAARKFKPDFILSSRAERALRTAEIVAERISLPENRVRREAALFEGSADALVRALVSLENDIEAPLVVGHNPALEHAAAALLSETGKPAGQGSLIRIPTAGLLCFDHDAPEWKTLKPGTAVLRWMITPKIIK
jgi:phosphohistidine phosphatase